MENLLKETIEDLKKHGKGPTDVRWVGSSDGAYWVDWAAFAAIANVEYDDGFGGQEIASDLVVVGDDWWLEREEYDGSEWWSFKRAPERPGGEGKTFATVHNGESWATIEEMNRPGGKYAS